MSLVADFSVPAEAFCLAGALESVPGMTVELNRLVAYSPDYAMPFLTARGDEWEAFEAALVEDETVEKWTVTDSFIDARLYQIQWATVVNERLQVFLDHEGVILEARGADGEWRLWVRFGARKQFSEFRDHFDEVGQVTLHHLTEPKAPDRAHYGVSEEQRETILAAYDAGYYEVPRTTTGTEIAEHLGITQQAVSGRLRRGVAALIESTLGREREQ